jgi:hypothetical protein
MYIYMFPLFTTCALHSHAGAYIYIYIYVYIYFSPLYHMRAAPACAEAGQCVNFVLLWPSFLLQVLVFFSCCLCFLTACAASHKPGNVSGLRLTSLWQQLRILTRLWQQLRLTSLWQQPEIVSLKNNWGHKPGNVSILFCCGLVFCCRY